MPSALPLLSSPHMVRYDMPLAVPSLMDRFMKRKRLAAFLFAGLFLGVILVAALLPKRYESHMQFLIQNERVNSLISPDQKAQGILYLDEVGESRINTEVALLTSDDLLRQVVRSTGLAKRAEAGGSANSRNEDIALQELRKNLSVVPLRKSDIIQVKYQTSDSQRATDVLRSLASSYVDLHLALRSAKGSSTFFNHLVAMYTDEQRAAAHALSVFKAQHNIVALAEEKSITLQRVEDLEKRFAEASSAEARAQQTIDELQSMASHTPETIVNEVKTVSNQYEAQQLSTLLVTLQNKRVEATARYVPTDRVIQDLDRQIVQTQQALDRANQHRAEEVSRVSNPVLSGIKSESVHASADYAGFKAQANAINRQLNLSRQRLQGLDEDTATYDNLSQQLKSATEQHDLYVAKANEARVSELLDKDHISNVTLAETPHESTLPSAPNRGLIVGLGFIWSLLFALGAPLLVDFFRKRIGSPSDLEKSLRTQVLTEIGSGVLRPQYAGQLSELHDAMQRTPARRLWRLA
jgi:uncharacterized protein involved in exopolysaccharide biosynthesis